MCQSGISGVGIAARKLKYIGVIDLVSCMSEQEELAVSEDDGSDDNLTLSYIIVSLARYACRNSSRVMRSSALEGLRVYLRVEGKRRNTLTHPCLRRDALVFDEL